MEQRIDDNKNGTYKIRYYPRVQGTLTLLVKVNGEHIRGSPFTVIVKAFHVKPVVFFGEYDCNEGYEGWHVPLQMGVAVNDRDELVVTDNHQVLLFSRNGKLLRS